MTRFTGVIGPAILCVGLGALSAEAATVTARRDLAAGETEWKAPMAAGKTLEIKGVIGQIDVVTAPGEEAIVTIERGEAPRLELLTHDEGYTLCAVHPSKNPKKPNECVPGTKGRLTQDMEKTHPAVRFKVQVPAGVGFLGRLAFGDMTAQTGRGNLNLETRVGTIKVIDSGSGFVDAKTFSGDVDVVLTANQAPVKRTVNLGVHGGNVRLVLPEIAVSYTIWASLIESKIQFEKGVVAGTFSGTFGDTEPHLTLYVSVAVGRVLIRRP